MTKNGFVSSATRSSAGLAARAAAPAPAPAPARPRPNIQSLNKAGGGHAVGGDASSSSAASASSSAEEPKKYHNPIEEKRLNPKWANQSGVRGRGLIDMLQEACSGAAVASLKHTGQTVSKEHKPMGGLQTLYDM